MQVITNGNGQIVLIVFHFILSIGVLELFQAIFGDLAKALIVNINYRFYI